MNIVIVTINQDHAAIASWLAAQDFSGCTLAHWQIEPQPMVAEQVLDALVEQWQRTPADVVLFPPGAFRDELSTRLAWRLRRRCKQTNARYAFRWHVRREQIKTPRCPLGCSN